MITKLVSDIVNYLEEKGNSIGINRNCDQLGVLEFIVTNKESQDSYFSIKIAQMTVNKKDEVKCTKIQVGKKKYTKETVGVI